MLKNQMYVSNILKNIFDNGYCQNILDSHLVEIFNIYH
jgi:hypothetical protein